MYQVQKSPGDGHCLLYSVLSSIRSQHDISVNIHDIIKLIKNETLCYYRLYDDFIDGEHPDKLLRGMNEYIYEKRYNSSFGDLVPDILANAMKIDVLILTKDGANYTCDFVYSTHDITIDSSHRGVLMLLKDDDHYDGIVRRPNIVTENECTSNNGNAIVYPTSEILPEKTTIIGSSSDDDIKLISWNINGLSQEKLNDDVLGSMLKEYDIILLSETWTSIDDTFDLQGFSYYNYPRLSKHQAAKRNSGGLGIFVRNSIQEGVEILNGNNDVIAWLRLHAPFFGTGNDIYVANVYIVPDGSVYHDDEIFYLLHDQLSKIPASAEVALCGDYNARTGVIPDFNMDAWNGSNGEMNRLMPDDLDRNLNVIEYLYENGILIRHSKDESTVNKHGLKLLELCKSTGLMIFNGRLGKDRGIGEFTRDDTTGRSVTDYVIGTPTLFLKVTHFNILPKLPESDHKAITFAVNCNTRNNTPQDKDRDAWKRTYKYAFTQGSMVKIHNALSDEISEHYRHILLSSMSELSETEDVANAFDAYLTQAITRECQHIRGGNKMNNKKLPWYDKECRLKRSEAIKAGERVVCERDRCIQYTACKNYRSCKQRKKREYRARCVENIEKAYMYDKSSM